MNAKANARGQRRTREAKANARARPAHGGKAGARLARTTVRLCEAGAAGDARAQGGDGAIAYISARSGAIIITRARSARVMNASTRLMFTIAGCMLAVAAVGGIVACLVVLLL